MNNFHFVSNPICERVCLVGYIDECEIWNSDGFSDSDPDDTWSLFSKSDSSTSSDVDSDLLIVTEITRLYIQINPVWSAAPVTLPLHLLHYERFSSGIDECSKEMESNNTR